MRSRFIFAVLAISLTIAGPTWARELVRAPEVIEGVNTLAVDLDPPFTGMVPSRDEGIVMPEDRDIPAQLKAALADKTDWDDIGGDDVTIQLGEDMGYCTIDIASNGDIYVAVAYSYATIRRIEIYRSRDGGQTWQDWGEFIGVDEFDCIDHPDLVIAEGDVDRCFLAFLSGPLAHWDIVVAYSPLSSTNGAWTEVVAMPGDLVGHQLPKIATDAPNFSGYYLYLVAQGRDGDGDDIWFARSTNLGASFETPYKIGSIGFPDREYTSPEISYGFGGHIHVAWYLRSWEGAVEAAIRYRTVPVYANGGLGSWDPIKAITTGDGIEDFTALIAASQNSSDVILTHRRGQHVGEDYFHLPPVVLHSTDDGTTFGPSTEILNGMFFLRTLEQRPNDGTWIMGGSWFYEAALQRASAADPLTWSDPECFTDFDYPGWIAGGKPVALDPSHDYRPATVWTNSSATGEEGFYFDAEWRSDPGFPNLEPGFPLGLWAPPLSPPAVVDVDGDGDLEIVFSDELHQIQVINHDGTSPPGWPRDVGVNLSDGPVAVGDLNGDGHPILVVGGTDGKAYAYDHQGNLLPGWPAAVTPPDNDIFVSIGAVGPPYPRSIVCTGANYITLRSHHGAAPPGTYGWSVSSYTHEFPAVMGDIDNDGVTEIVAGLGQRIFAFQKGVASLEFNVSIPSALSDALTLGDLDQDGDLEILCPTVSGILYALDHTGTPLGGNFPYNTADTGPLTSAAIANFRGTSAPDIVFAHRDWTVHALYHDGGVISGFPANTSPGWFVWGAPIVGRVNGITSDVVIGDRGDDAWAWTNAGFTIDGWPRDVLDQVNLAPAMGDIDLDGNNEVVILTDTQLLIMDLNIGVNSSGRTWAMYGHDPQRTGCSDCSEDLVTPVDPEDREGAITRVSFAGPSPNPISGTTRFSFAVPLRSAVSLEIIDLRGRRIYTVYREETDPGPQVVTWNGRDTAGRPVASGTYFARLRVRGAGLNEELTRKLMVIK